MKTETCTRAERRVVSSGSPLFPHSLASKRSVEMVFKICISIQVAENNRDYAMAVQSHRVLTTICFLRLWLGSESHKAGNTGHHVATSRKHGSQERQAQLNGEVHTDNKTHNVLGLQPFYFMEHGAPQDKRCPEREGGAISPGYENLLQMNSAGIFDYVQPSIPPITFNLLTSLPER